MPRGFRARAKPLACWDWREGLSGHPDFGAPDGYQTSRCDRYQRDGHVDQHYRPLAGPTNVRGKKNELAGSFMQTKRGSNPPRQTAPTPREKVLGSARRDMAVDHP